MRDGKLLDPYDGSFWYQCPGIMNPETYDLWSTGPDAEHGDGGGDDPKNARTSNDNDDVTNWKGDFKE